MRKPLYFLLLLIFITGSHLSAQTLNWGFNNGGTAADGTYLSRVHKDKSGNVYQCGVWGSSTMDVDPSAATYTLTNHGGDDGFVAKYSPSGSLIWAFNLGGTDNDGVMDVTTDSAQNVYVVGYFRNTADFNPSATGIFNLTSNGSGGSSSFGGDGFVAKYDANGNFLWAFNIGGTYVYDVVHSVSVSPGGTVYISGNINMTSPVDFDPSPTVTQNLDGTNGFAFLAKYTTNGQYVWAFNFGGAYMNASSKTVELDHKTGKLFVSGHVQGNNFDMNPSPTAANYLSGSTEDVFLAAYDTNMNYIFAFNVPTAYTDEALDMTLDSSNVYLTGYIQGSAIDFDPSPSGSTNITTSGLDFFIAKYNKSGQFKWVKTAGASGADRGIGISVDGNNVYATGDFSGTVDFDPSANTYNLTSAGGTDAFVTRHDTSGNFLCAFRYGSTGNDLGYAVKGYNGNKLLTGGGFVGTIAASPAGTPVSIASNGSTDFFFGDYTWNGCYLLAPADTIINKYAAVLARQSCTNTITVDTATGFNVGDTVLMIQMKGAVIDSTNTAAFGTVTDYRGAGNYEYNVIKAKNGNDITLKYRIIRNYNIPDGKVQIVRVPSYQNYTVNQQHTCMPWNGSKGGVFVVSVANTLALNANIDVSGKGFRGGQINGGTTYTCNQADYFYPLSGNDGGQKGEGIAELSNAKMRGKGKLANGGGGGNNTNAGGGGGGNAALGGNGGHQWANCDTSLALGGNGGSGLLYSTATNKIFLGGGGGAGHENNADTDPAGNGGGMVIINTQTISGSGFSVKANGASCIDNNSLSGSGDGQSGGGAGGTVLIKANTISAAPNIEAKGGNGGNVYAVSIHGPGAGGSGGAVLFAGSATVPATSINTIGGNNGMVVNYSTANSAQPGQSGQTLTGLQLNLPVDTFKPNQITVNFTDSIVNCYTRKLKDLTTTSTTGIASWSWQFPNNSTSSLQNPVFTFSGYGSFPVTLVVTDSNGCKDSLTKNINIPYVHFARAGNDTTTCFGGTATLHASGGTSYAWSPASGVSNPNAAVTIATPTANPTTYIVTVTNVAGCTDNDTVNVSLVQGANIIAAPHDTASCKGKTINLTASGGVSYTWSPATGLSNPNIANPVATVDGNQQYIVTGKSANGCTGSDTVNITETPGPVISVTSNGNMVSCYNRSVQLYAHGALYYRWHPGMYCNDSTIPSPSVTPPVTTTFTVTGYDAGGCSSTDTITVLSYKDVAVYMPNAFTPNGDGLNDVIKPMIFCDFVFEQFLVFDRWGENVFSSYNPDNGWDGMYKGNPAMLGVYHYFVKGRKSDGSPAMIKGNFTLIR